MTKDLSYLQVFSPKVLRGARRILEKGFTLEDINRFLEQSGIPKGVKTGNPGNPGTKLEKPCCGEGKIDKQVEAFKEKQRKLRIGRSR